MNLQKILLNNTTVARKVLERIPPSLLVKIGKGKAKEAISFAFQTAAYKDFLKQNGISSLKNQKYNSLPITDKINYIDKYSLEQLAAYPLFENYTIEQSSGYGGKPYYWIRFVGQDDGMANYLQMGLEKSFLIHERKTLFINTFALGTWVAGVKLARSSCEVANKKRNKLTVVNTGTVKEDIINAVKDLSKHYEQVLFMGYPPLLEDIIEYSIDNKYFPEGKYIGIIAGGEPFPETWRDYITSLFEKINPKEVRIFSAFGAADTGLEIGYEQPITIQLRKALVKNKDLRHRILGKKVNYVPHFFQYNPMAIHIEEYNNELLFTAKAGIPIVRYNLHDRGGLMTYNEMISILKQSGVNTDKLEKEHKPMKLPVVYVFGRSDGSISVDGANIYVQDIQSVLSDDDKLLKYMNKSYKNYTSLYKKIPYTRVAKKIFELSNNIEIEKSKYFRIINNFKLVGHQNKIELFIELIDNVRLTREEKNGFEKALYKALVLMLAEQSANYRALLDENLASSDIELHIVEYSKSPFEARRTIKQKHIIN